MWWRGEAVGGVDAIERFGRCCTIERLRTMRGLRNAVLNNRLSLYYVCCRRLISCGFARCLRSQSLSSLEWQVCRVRELPNGIHTSNYVANLSKSSIAEHQLATTDDNTFRQPHHYRQNARCFRSRRPSRQVHQQLCFLLEAPGALLQIPFSSVLLLTLLQGKLPIP